MPTAHYSVTVTNEPPITAEQWELYKQWAAAKTVMCVAAIELGLAKRSHIQSAFEAEENHEYARKLKSVLGIDKSNKTAVQVKKFTRSQTWPMMAAGYVTKEGGDVWTHNCDLDSDELVNGRISYELAKLRGKELAQSTLIREAVKYAKEKCPDERELFEVVARMCTDDGYSLSVKVYDLKLMSLRDEFKMCMAGKRYRHEMEYLFKS